MSESNDRISKQLAQDFVAIVNELPNAEVISLIAGQYTGDCVSKKARVVLFCDKEDDLSAFLGEPVKTENEDKTNKTIYDYKGISVVAIKKKGD